MKAHASLWLTVVAAFVLSALTAPAHPSSGIVVDRQGNVFFSDLSRGLLKVDPQGKVTTISKEGGHWLALDTNGSFSKVVLEHINANSEAHEDWPPRVRRVGRDGKVTTLVTFAPERR